MTIAEKPVETVTLPSVEEVITAHAAVTAVRGEDDPLVPRLSHAMEESITEETDIPTFTGEAAETIVASLEEVATNKRLDPQRQPVARWMLDHVNQAPPPPLAPIEEPKDSKSHLHQAPRGEPHP